VLALILPVGWQWLEGQLEDLVPGQTGVAAVSTKMGLVTREEPAAPWIAGLDPFTVAKVQDVDAFVNGDLLLSHQREKAAETVRTVYQGPTEHPGLNRWVHITPSTGQAWWRLAWKSDDTLHQVMAWAPSEDLDELAKAMLDFESKNAVEADPQLLVVGKACDEVATVSRVEVVAGAARSKDAALAAERRGGSVELHMSASAILFRAAESCLTEVAPRFSVCRVYEGPAVTERDRNLQTEASKCIDKREPLPGKLAARLDTVAEW